MLRTSTTRRFMKILIENPLIYSSIGFKQPHIDLFCLRFLCIFWMFEMWFVVVKYRLPSVDLHAVVGIGTVVIQLLINSIHWLKYNLLPILYSVRVLYCSGPKNQRVQQTAESRQQTAAALFHNRCGLCFEQLPPLRRTPHSTAACRPPSLSVII
jgi:hypothetical protein